jgi:CheY-like chemotaxis protein
METEDSVLKNIWLADDDDDDHLVFENAIKEVLPFVKLTQFRSCHTLLSELEHSTPDLLFLDINMPGLNGKECLKSLKAGLANRKLPVIVYTGSGSPMDITACYSYGATLYVEKASTYSKMVGVLRALFGLDWDDPEKITSDQYVNNRFTPFRAEEPIADVPEP